MSLGLLGALIAAGLLGPIFRSSRVFSVPIAVGEIFVGIVLGKSWLGVVPVDDPTLRILATIGFALLMLTAGSHIDYRAITKKMVVTKSLLILMLNLLCASALGYGIGHIVHFNNWKLLSIIAFSSSAAFVVPLVAQMDSSESLVVLVAQVTIADTVAFMLLPFVTEKSGHVKAALGSGAILAVAFILYLILREINSRGWIVRMHEASKKDQLALELRISLSLVLLLAALALRLHASTLVAGFSLGIVLAAIGVPHRLARQLFAVSEGLFSPLYFIWLGASIDIRSALHHRDALVLTLLLFLISFLSHMPALFFGASPRNVFLATAQLGIPAAAVTLASANGMMDPGTAGAIMLSALGTLVLSSLFLHSPRKVVQE
jgi:Kef-type K+ transport system membrane component KefB